MASSYFKLPTTRLCRWLHIC